MMIQRLKKVVEKNKNNIAYKINNKSITYNQLWNEIVKYGEILKSYDDSPIVVFGSKSVEYIISIFSCLYAKKTYIPIDKSCPIYRIKKIIKNANVNLIITNEDINIENISVNNLGSLEKKSTEVIESKYAYIIFTSGSTGDPKGVPITYQNLNNFINWISNIEPLNEYKNINVLNQASFSFDLSVADIFYSIFNGHTLVSLSNNDLETIYSTIKEEKINLIVCTPTFMKLCLLDKNFREEKFPTLNSIYFCGERLEISVVQKLYQRFKNIKIINAYGPTEATSAVSSILINKDMLKEKLLPVGEIDKTATKLEIIDGEIVLSGKSVFKGYLNSSNQEILYKTGDIGYIKDNKIYCIGRKDRQIKFNGYRIELDEIEAVINSIKGVNNSAVVALYNNDVVKGIKAYIETVYEVEVIKKELQEKLPSYMIPKSIIILDKIPINKNGKIDRKELL